MTNNAKPVDVNVDAQECELTTSELKQAAGGILSPEDRIVSQIVLPPVEDWPKPTGPECSMG